MAKRATTQTFSAELMRAVRRVEALKRERRRLQRHLKVNRQTMRLAKKELKALMALYPSNPEFGDQLPEFRIFNS